MMEHCRYLFLVVLSFWPSSIFPTACGSQPKTLRDLRRFKNEAVIGRFVVKRDALERELHYRRQQDAVCRQDVNLQLPQSLPRSPYNISYLGEITLMYGTITDYGLASELTDDLKERIATSYTCLDVNIPVLIGNERHGILSLRLFSNSTVKVLHPYYTSMKEVTKVDSIEEADDGTVTIRLGDDVMIFQVVKKVNCSSKLEKNVGKDFDQLAVSDKVVTFTNYPLPFDWGCELWGSQISFCEVLGEVRCELAASGGDVCTLMSPTSSKRCPTSFSIVSMTGKFQEMLPFLTETFPSESFQAESIGREYTAGIVFPCLTP